MAVTQKSTITDVNTGAVIGLSDTINNYTFDDLWDYAYVASQFDELCNFLDRTQDTCIGLKEYLNGETGKLPVTLTRTHNGPAFDYAGVTYNEGTMQYNNPDGIFCRVIWLYSTGTMNLPTTKGNSTAKVITSLDMSKISLKMNDYGEAAGTVAPFDDVTTWTSVKPISWTMQYNGTNMAESGRIYPYLMFRIGDRGYINRLFYKVNLTDYLFGVNQSYKDPDVWSNVYSGNKEVYNQIYTSNMVRTYETTDIVYKALALNVLNADTNPSKMPYTYNMFRSGWNPYQSYNTDTEGVGAYINFSLSGAGGITYGAFSHDKFKDLCSRIGLNFETDKKYKVIIKDGEVLGYTDNLTAESDIDKYTGGTKHDVPDKPTPKPKPDEDDPWDKINFGPGGGNLGVFAKFYLCTATDLANLRSWFAGGGHQQIPEGFDPMTQIIGLSQFATSVSGTAVDEAEITFRAADNTPVYTGVFCQRGSGADLTFDLGSIQIPLRMKERGVPFLDYSSTVELYIPFCGAFQLDPQTVLGRTVAVRMWMSTTTGECFAIATADGSPIAYGSGIMNAEMPISSSGWGVYKAALTNITDKYTGNIITEIGGIVRTAAEGAIAGAAVGSVVPGAGTVAGAGVGATAALIAGTANAGIQGAKVGHTIGAGLTEYNHLKKSSTTSISGSLSSTAAWHQPFTPYIKITRPHYQKPDNYAHTQAIPLVATKTLSDCAGLTMCVKTDLSGINATEYEKTVIASLLESGVIV